MSQLVKSKSQMGGTLVSAFYERSEEDNDNGEILSIAHAVEVTPEYQPLKPYSKEFRNRVDDISKRRQFKDEAFNGKNTIEDMYSKRVVQKDSADVDHTYSIKKAYGDASIFNTEADIKKAVNQKQNYKITDSSFNRSKGAKTNTEYLIKELQHGNDKNITVSEARKLIVEGTKAKAIVEGSLKIQFRQHARTDLVLSCTMNKLLSGGIEGKQIVAVSLMKEIIHLRSDVNTLHSLPLPVVSVVNPQLASNLAAYGLDMANVLTVAKQATYATMINALIAMFHGMFSDATTAMEEKLYEVKTRKILSYSNIVASSSNLAIVAITKDFHKLDLGGLAVTIYRLITDRKFIRQVKEEFIFGSYKDMIMNDYI